jgi:creatinine amidohydrolase
MGKELLPVSSFLHVQYERLLPWQLRERIMARPVAYIPLGTYEWHGEHLPVGLDSLTSHGVCLRAAAQDGGIVLPPLYYGTGGGHGDYPWSMMMASRNEIAAELAFTLHKLKHFGLKCVVLFSGHFPLEQLEMIDDLAHNASVPGFTVFATAVNRIEGLAYAPDHAAIFETTLLYALHPELVQLERLPTTPLPTHDVDMGEMRHDPSHPIWGVFGPDPRRLDPATAQPLLDASVTWLVTQVKQRIDQIQS